MSTLKHTIRQQQAQLNSLENIVRTGPRPYAPNMVDELSDTLQVNPNPYLTRQASSSSLSTAPPPSSFVAPVSPSTSPISISAIKMKRRSSYDVLHDLAGPESSLPLPRRVESSVSLNTDGDGSIIREGVPLSFGVGGSNGLSSSQSKRIPSPTRTLSRKYLYQHSDTQIADGAHRNTYILCR